MDQPVVFHSVHADNIRLSREGCGASLVGVPNCPRHGLTFSSRPVRVNEKIHLRILEPQGSGGSIVVGFTNHNPNNLTSIKNSEVLLDLAFQPGYWAEFIRQDFCIKNSILDFHVDSAGTIHFGINGVEKGVLTVKVNTSTTLWALIELWGWGTAVELQRTPAQEINPNTSAEDRLVEFMESLSVTERFPLVPVSLHSTKGKNIQLLNQPIGVAARDPSKQNHGYIFAPHPMRPGQTFLVQIVETNTRYSGSLAFGFTSCDPSRLRPTDLPDNSEVLLCRSELWDVTKNAAKSCSRGDELAFCLATNGEIHTIIKGSVKKIRLNQFRKIWLFLDVYGATQKIRLWSTQERTSTIPQDTTRSDGRPHNMSQNLSQQEQRSRPEISTTHVPEQSSPNIPSSSSDEEVSGRKECTICCERPINCVLYKCGHMHMCYDCAMQQWQGVGSGKCPVCRVKIENVIRTYQP